MPASFESLTLDAQGLPLHVRQRHASGAPVVLFLHGWLDHSHTFDALTAHLPDDWRLVLMDFRGMGRSGHVGGGGTYHFSDYVLDVESVRVGLGLDAVHLVGHSLGGIVMLAYAAARPAHVKSAFLIESLGPTAGTPAAALDRLRGFLDDSRRPPNRKRYARVEDAAARLRENNPSLPEPAALHLARHGTQPFDGGVAFTFDPRHRRRFGQSYDEAQWLAVQAGITCPVRLLRGTKGLTPDEAVLHRRLAALPTLAGPPLVVPGGHHVHMEQPETVARAIADFIRGP